MSLKSIEYIDASVYMASIDQRLKIAEITGGLITGFYYTEIESSVYVFGEARIDNVKSDEPLHRVDLTLNIADKEQRFWIPVSGDGFTIDKKQRPYGFFSCIKPLDVPSLDEIIRMEFPAENPLVAV